MLMLEVCDLMWYELFWNFIAILHDLLWVMPLLLFSPCSVLVLRGSDAHVTCLYYGDAFFCCLHRCCYGVLMELFIPLHYGLGTYGAGNFAHAFNSDLFVDAIVFYLTVFTL